jgi:serine/threonine protein kinase
MALQIGERVGDYEVQALLGAGGMGQVYKVRNIISNREEAMKVLLPDLTSERELAVRFMMEIRTLAGLEHPNIAQLRTAFQFQNQLIMIMEYVEGVTLEKLATEQAIPVDRVLDYSTQVLSALSFAHTHGVIHRDIKPANVMITTHGMVKLMDFGIAKNAEEMHLTRPGMTIGSVYYISPEQIRDGTVDARSDLYSFGITMYELLTRRKPFQADTSYTVLHAQCNEPPIPPIQVNPALSPALNAIILKALEKDPAARFQTAQEFHDALKALVEPASRPSAVPVTQPFTAAPTLADELSATLAGYTPVPGAASATPVPMPAAQPMQQQQAPASATPAPPPSGPASTNPVPPAFAPVAVAPIRPPAKGNRGLWIGLGALAAILALVAVAVLLPHLYAIMAKQKAAPAPSPDTTTSASSNTPPAPTPAPDASTASPATTPATTPDAGSAVVPAAGLPAAQPAPAPPAPAGKPASHGQSGGAQPRPAYTGPAGGAGSSGGGSAPAATAASAPAPTGPSPQELRQAKDKLMNIEARADAAKSGVQSLRSQQQAQGMDLRGDIVAAMSRLNNDLREAHTALAQNDMETAEQYMARADKETSTLEAFLGR